MQVYVDLTAGCRSILEDGERSVSAASFITAGQQFFIKRRAKKSISGFSLRPTGFGKTCRKALVLFLSLRKCTDHASFFSSSY